MTLMTRLSYLASSAVRGVAADITCPFDGLTHTRLVKRKYLVTALYECQECGLRFRVPKDTVQDNKTFYQDEYAQGFTTDLPDDGQLAQLTATGFAGSPKDYAGYLKVLAAIGVLPGQRIFDFGASWGYGSWQFRQAGYAVYSYEISRPRARYAAEKLGCTMLESVQALPGPVDCFFSAHVLEHLPDPKIFWEAVSAALKPGGIILSFTPNGDPAYEQASPAAYHQQWGKVHPLMLTAQSYQQMARQYGCTGQTYSSPYDFSDLKRDVVSLTGSELLFVGRRA